MARPRKLESELRTFRPRVCFARDEFAAVEVRAREAGLPTARFIREMSVGGMVPSIPRVNAEAWSELAATTANLNQLAHHANAGEHIGAELLPVLETLRDQVAALRRQLLGAAE